MDPYVKKEKMLSSRRFHFIKNVKASNFLMQIFNETSLFIRNIGQF